jgi:hypothetical protein
MYEILQRNCRIYFDYKINLYKQYFYSNFSIDKQYMITIKYIFINHNGIIKYHDEEISFDKLNKFIVLHEDDFLRECDNTYHFLIKEHNMTPDKSIKRTYVIFRGDIQVCEISDASYYNIRQFVIWLNKNGCNACFDFKNYHELLKQAGIDF